MAYRLKASESVPEGIKRIVLEEIDSATQLLLKHRGGGVTRPFTKHAKV